MIGAECLIKNGGCNGDSGCGVCGVGSGGDSAKQVLDFRRQLLPGSSGEQGKRDGDVGGM